MIDFVVTDTAGSGSSQGGVAAGEGGGQSAQSTISRYACRIMCERSAPYTARIYAAGFDSSKNIFLGVSALSLRGARLLLLNYTRMGNHGNPAKSDSRDRPAPHTGDIIAVGMAVKHM